MAGALQDAIAAFLPLGPFRMISKCALHCSSMSVVQHTLTLSHGSEHTHMAPLSGRLQTTAAHAYNPKPRDLALQTTSFLKLRWFVGTAFLAAPVAFCHYRAAHAGAVPLPKDAAVHIAIAWAVGGLMSFLADTYRRCALGHMGSGFRANATPSLNPMGDTWTHCPSNFLAEANL